MMVGSASARDLISVSVNGIQRASGNNFIDLIDDALAQVGAFSDLADLPNYSVEIEYLGIRNAIVVDASSSGNVVELSIPSTGFSQLFTGVDPDDVEEQVEDFLKTSGSKTVAKFLEAARGRSPLAVLDGNPRSTTALLARSAFQRFGLGAPRARARNGTLGAYLSE
jgi:hypothetical protein